MGVDPQALMDELLGRATGACGGRAGSMNVAFFRDGTSNQGYFIDSDDPYRHISLLGEAEEIYVDEDLADIDRLALRYTGAPYQTRDSDRVSAWVRLGSWHGWDASRARVTHAAWDADAGG